MAPCTKTESPWLFLSAGHHDPDPRGLSLKLLQLQQQISAWEPLVLEPVPPNPLNQPCWECGSKWKLQ